MSPEASIDPVPRPPEQLRTKLAKTGSFGWIVLDLRLLTEEQLAEALEVQKARERGGDFARLGAILVELGLLSPDQVQQVLQAQKITILSCSACSSQYNIRGFRPSSNYSYKCPKCHADLVPADTLLNVAVQDQLETQYDDAGDETVKLARPEATNTAKIRQLRRLGKYEILGEIARGGMGIIYKARQMDLDRIVALKTLRTEELDKPGAADRFHDEARAVAQLRHPNIVAVHEVGTQDGIVYFTMEFIEGLPLDRHLIREEEGLTTRQAVEIVSQIAESLVYSHRVGVVHRDLKPANIIVDLEGVPFLVDWGIAKRLEGPRLEYDEEEDLLGSIPYMAPEYVEGSAYDEQCDLYSLGVLFYESLAGPNKLPYYDDDTRRFLEKIVVSEFRPICDWVPDLDPAVVTIVEKMIAPRAKRYRDMTEVVEDMQRWLVGPSGGGPEPFQSVAPRVVAAPPPPQSSAFTSILGVIAVAALAALGWLTVQVGALKDRLSDQETRQIELSRHEAETLCRTHLAHAKRLKELKRLDEALETSTLAINQALTQKLDVAVLAEAYRLRAGVRESLKDEGAADDLREAQRLDPK
jgi:serine/threonine protein kinase